MQSGIQLAYFIGSPFADLQQLGGQLRASVLGVSGGLAMAHKRLAGWRVGRFQAFPQCGESPVRAGFTGVGTPGVRLSADYLHCGGGGPISH